MPFVKSHCLLPVFSPLPPPRQLQARRGGELQARAGLGSAPAGGDDATQCTVMVQKDLEPLRGPPAQCRRRAPDRPLTSDQ